MQSRKVKTIAAVPPPKSGLVSQMCSAWELDSTSFAWDNRWGMPLEAAAVGAFAGDDVMRAPTSAVFQQARRWWRLHRFIQTVCHYRTSFYNFGLLGRATRPVNAKKPDGAQEVEWHPGIRPVNPKDADKLSVWKKENASEIQRVVLDVWRERLITRNVVALWRKNGRVLVRPPEQCHYTDEFGNEKLIIKHGLTSEQVQKMNGLSAEEKKVLSASQELTLTHGKNPTAADRLFSFAVQKDEPVGMGFGWPDLVTLFHVCSLEESLLVGDRQLADVCRTVYEQHKLGHDIKSGLHAGSPAHFINKTRAEATKKQIKSKKGHVQIATNFDHEIIMGAGRPDPKQYDALRYKTVAEQMAVWGMPIAQMLLGVVNPFLMTLLAQIAEFERQRMGPFLEHLLAEALSAPAPVFCQFDNSCFWDSRLLLDVLKSGLSTGPLSQETFLTRTGFNAAEERARKQAEGELPDAVVEPAFDAAHGKREAGAPGKPPGNKDKS